MSELMHYTPRKGNHKYIDVKIVNGKPQYVYHKSPGRYRDRNGLRSAKTVTDKWSGSGDKYAGRINGGNFRSTHGELLKYHTASPTPESYKDGSKMTRKKRIGTRPSSGVLPRFIPTSESYKDGSSMKRKYKASPTPESYKNGSSRVKSLSYEQRKRETILRDYDRNSSEFRNAVAAVTAKTGNPAYLGRAWSGDRRNPEVAKNLANSEAKRKSQEKYKSNSERMKSGSSAAHTPNYAPNKQTLAKRTGSQSNYSHNSEKFKSGTTITRSVGTAKENRHKRTDAATKNKKVTTGYQQYRTTPENMKSGSMAGRSANTNKKKKGLANKIANGWNSLKKKFGWR